MYFEKAGRSNTHQTLVAAFERAQILGIQEVVVASSRGETDLQAHDVFKECRLTVVTYHGGFEEPFESVMPSATRTDLLDKGIKVISATHALSGVERSVAKKHGGIYPALLIADTLRLFGQGTKVAVEITIMAADAGVLSGKDVIAIGGTGRGADTALVLKPADQSSLFDLRIREIVCKPRFF